MKEPKRACSQCDFTGRTSNLLCPACGNDLYRTESQIKKKWEIEVQKRKEELEEKYR